MTIRLDMRKAVSRAAETLGDSVDAVREFLRCHLCDDGGFQGRDGRSDLYYTVFGLEASLALDVKIPPERVVSYLRGFGTGQSLDLVHLASLVRCQINLAEGGNDAIDPASRRAMIAHLMHFRAVDGGFSTSAGAERGHVYGSFLALGICQDLQVDDLEPAGVLESVRSLQMPDGGFSNEPTMAVSATAATAAAVTIFHYLKAPLPESALQWLAARAEPGGGVLRHSSRPRHRDPRSALDGDRAACADAGRRGPGRDSREESRLSRRLVERARRFPGPSGGRRAGLRVYLLRASVTR